MITNGESQIDKVVAVMPDGRVGSPCGACREYMMQLDKNSGDIEILLELETVDGVIALINPFAESETTMF